MASEQQRFVSAQLPPKTLTHDVQGKSMMEIALEEIELERDTLELLAHR